MTERRGDAGSESDQACRFLMVVGKAAHSYGSTTAQVWSSLSRLIGVPGYQGTFRATATEILIAFQQKVDSRQRIHVEALASAGQELNRLARVGELVEAVAAAKERIRQRTATREA